MLKKTIVYTVDGNDQALKWLDVSLCSLRKCLGNDVRVVICTDSPRDFGYGTECVDVRPTIEKYGVSRISKMEWYGKPVPPLQVFRLALPILPELADTDRIVFVDADTEFVDSRWGEIFAESMDGAMVAGVKDGGTTDRFIALRHKDFILKRDVVDAVGEGVLRQIRDGAYVNGGVLVMDLKAIRESSTYAEKLMWLIDFCVRNDLKYLDQDIINLFFTKKLLPSRYNSSDHLHYPGEPTYLEHYTGKEKWTGKVYPPIKYQLARSSLGEGKNVDIVYTVGSPSIHDDIELRWSLRSIAKYGRNVGRVIVTSPVARDWLSDEVIQVDCQDIPNAGYKHHNIMRSILETVKLLDLNGEFLVSSDDHYYVKETDFASQPFVAQHWDIPSQPKGGVAVQTMLWQQSCIDTREFLHSHGMPTIDFQMHRNSKWHGGLVKERMDIFLEAQKMRFGCEPHVLMQNLWVHTQPNVKVEFRKDCKINEYHGIEPWCDCISCYDQAFDDKAFIDFMNKEFGEKCQYER